MKAPEIVFALLLPAIACQGTPEEDAIREEVRAFVDKAKYYDEGIVDHFDRERSHRILANPRDWELALAEMLDLNSQTELEIDTVIAIIRYRKSSGDARVQKALIRFIDQLYAVAAKVAADEKQGIKEPPPKVAHRTKKQRLASYSTSLARMNDPGLLLKLMDYAASKQEEDLRAFTNSTYANIFIAAKEVGAAEHAARIRRLAPMLRQRGMDEKTIALAEDALVAIREKHGPVVGEGERKGGALKRTDDGTHRGLLATLAVVLAFVVIFLVFRTWKRRARP